MLLTHWTSHELLHSPGLSDSTFVAPCQWRAKLVTDYSVEKICEKYCVLMNLYTLKNYEICRFIKNKKYAIGQLNPYP